jgi:ABC-2 type transport system permease protein
MSLWKLEWLRLVRTRRLLALAAVFVVFGFGSPLLTRYLTDVLAAGTPGGVKLVVPDPTPADGIASYQKNVQQLGAVLLAFIAAAAFRGRAEVFLRTRITRRRDHVLPGVVVTTLAAWACYLAGLLGAWYETAVLLGGPGIVAMLAVAGFTLLYLAFAVALTLAIASFTRTAVPAGFASTALLLVVLPLLAGVRELGDYLPPDLPASALSLVAGTSAPADHWRAVAVTLAATVALVAVGLSRAPRGRPAPRGTDRRQPV